MQCTEDLFQDLSQAHYKALFSLRQYTQTAVQIAAGQAATAAMEVLRNPAHSCKPTPAPVTKTKLAPKKQAG